MRLKEDCQKRIVEIVSEELGPNTVVSLFGSRLNDEVKGGDVDLLIESEKVVPVLTKARIMMRLEAELNLPVDIIVISPGLTLTAFQKMARSKSTRL
mgnify:CR=1 FL=1